MALRTAVPLGAPLTPPHAVVYAPCGQSLCPAVEFAPTPTERNCACGAAAHPSCGCKPQLVDHLTRGGKNTATGVSQLSGPAADPSAAKVIAALAEPEPQVATGLPKTVSTSGSLGALGPSHEAAARSTSRSTTTPTSAPAARSPSWPRSVIARSRACVASGRPARRGAARRRFSATAASQPAKAAQTPSRRPSRTSASPARTRSIAPATALRSSPSVSALRRHVWNADR